MEVYIQNIDDNECFKWCLVRSLNPLNHHPARITKAKKDFSKRLDFKDIKLSVESRKIYNTEKNNSTSISGYKEKHVHLLLIWEKGKRHCVLIKNFNTWFMYDNTVHRQKKLFYRYCWQTLSAEERLKRHINGKKIIIMPKKGE